MEVNASRRRGRPPKSQNLVTAQPSDPELEHLPDVPDLQNHSQEQKIKRAMFHQGVWCGTIMQNSLDEKKDNCELSLRLNGVMAYMKNTDRYFFVPFSVITGIELYPPHE